MSALAFDRRYTTSYMVTREPHGRDGGISDIASWTYRRELGDWRVHVHVPNIMGGEPYDGWMVGNAVCDDFGVLRILGSLS